jgi:hypothetical protein
MAAANRGGGKGEGEGEGGGGGRSDERVKASALSQFGASLGLACSAMGASRGVNFQDLLVSWYRS